jgi:hypothetical protein
MNRGARSRRCGGSRNGLDALGVSTHNRDLGAASGQLDRSRLADTASGAGEQDERHEAGLYRGEPCPPG